MNCQEFWDAMPELEAEPPADHLRECPACAALWDRQSALRTGLREVAADWKRLGAPLRTEARLVAALRAQDAVASRGGAGRWWLPVMTWVSAAAATMALAAFLLRDRPAPPPHRSDPSTRASALIQASVEPDPGYDVPDAGDFIPLPNVPQIGPNDDVNIVRVEVPRSAMIALGFAVSADRAAEPVEADVLMGADGLARAVRFVDE
jgi:hypothetical protein